jgi:hypothetical protein
MNVDWAAVWQWLGSAAGVVIVGVGATYKLWLPPLKDFVFKWIDKRFEATLQKTEHLFQDQLNETKQKHDVLTRHVQSVIDRELDRARKLQDREFDALTKGWSILHQAYWRTRDAISTQKTIADMTIMHPLHLEQFIDECKLPNWQKQRLREIEDINEKQAAHEDFYRWYEYGECRRWKFKLVQFIDRNAIFIQPHIKQRFNDLHDMISSALTEHGLRIKKDSKFDKYVVAYRLRDEGEPLYHELEQLIHDRLWEPVFITQ